MCSNTGYGRWVLGTVIKCWYRERAWPAHKWAAYQVRLENGGLVYQIVDEDEVCKTPPGSEAPKSGELEKLEKLEPRPPFSWFATGEPVIIHGLSAASQWNGKRGTVLDYNLRKGRYQVQVSLTKSATAATKALGVRPINLVLGPSPPLQQNALQESVTDIDLAHLHPDLLFCIVTAEGSLDSRDLGRLECTSHAFSREFTEKAAATLIRRRKNNDRAPHRPGDRCLEILRELEQLDAPCTFARWGEDAAGFDISRPVRTDEGFNFTLTEGRQVAAVSADFDGYSEPVCVTSTPMRAGVHHTEFDILGESFGLTIGICGALYTPDFQGGPSGYIKAGMGWNARSGALCFNGDQDPNSMDKCMSSRHQYQWPGSEPYGKGDTIGLQVDFGRDTVTAFKNGRRLGLLVNGLSRVLGAGPLKQDGW